MEGGETANFGNCLGGLDYQGEKRWNSLKPILLQPKKKKWEREREKLSRKSISEEKEYVIERYFKSCLWQNVWCRHPPCISVIWWAPSGAHDIHHHLPGIKEFQNKIPVYYKTGYIQRGMRQYSINNHAEIIMTIYH